AAETAGRSIRTEGLRLLLLAALFGGGLLRGGLLGGLLRRRLLGGFLHRRFLGGFLYRRFLGGLLGWGLFGSLFRRGLLGRSGLLHRFLCRGGRSRRDRPGCGSRRRWGHGRRDNRYRYHINFLFLFFLFFLEVV